MEDKFNLKRFCGSPQTEADLNVSLVVKSQMALKTNDSKKDFIV